MSKLSFKNARRDRSVMWKFWSVTWNSGQSRGNSGHVCKKQRQISDLRRDRSVTWKFWSGMQETETDLRPQKRQVSHGEILVRYARNRDRFPTSEETGQSRGNSGQVCKKQRQISDLIGWLPRHGKTCLRECAIRLDTQTGLLSYSD